MENILCDDQGNTLCWIREGKGKGKAEGEGEGNLPILYCNDSVRIIKRGFLLHYQFQCMKCNYSLNMDSSELRTTYFYLILTTEKDTCSDLPPNDHYKLLGKSPQHCNKQISLQDIQLPHLHFVTVLMFLMLMLERKNKYLSHLLRKAVVMAIRSTFPKYKYHSGSCPRRLPIQQMTKIIKASV